jgi:hypothetical protein
MLCAALSGCGPRVGPESSAPGGEKLLDNLVLDGSQLGITLFDHTQTQPGSPHYLIVIQVSAPKQ